jgi:arylsulfatase A-like enzyme
MATGVGVVLLAGLLLAIVDVVHTRGAPLQVLALWSLLALPASIGVGLVLAAGNATWGNGWVRRLFARLRDDAELDKHVSAIVLASVVVAGVLVLGISKLSIGLVGEVQRKAVGGLLLGAIVIALIPLLALGVLPLYRVTRRIAPIVPAIGPVPRVVLLVIAGAVAGVLGALAVLFKGLEAKSLSLVSLFVPAMMPVLAIVIAALAYGPLARVRERIPVRGALAAAGAVIAAVLPVIALRGKPSEATVIAITERSYVGNRMIPALRKLSDSDHDGESAFFGGPDCDDSNKNLNTQAEDIPDDGLDQNCDGFDNTNAAKLPTLPTEQPKTTLRGGDNVLIIFVDTLRFDRLGFTGYKRDGKSLTPHLDAFAAQSVVFSKAYAQASNTPRSVPSFLASRYPSQLEVDAVEKNYPTNLDDNEFLFETLKGAGFKTYGMSSHFYFCDRSKYPDTCPDVNNSDGAPMRTNAIQGADEWDNAGALKIYDKEGPDSNKDFAGPRIIAKTKKKLSELATAKTKFAMIVHLFEPHSTYIKHDGYPITESGTAALSQKYDYEIAVEDTLIGELLAHLDETKLAANTTVVVIADHGEAFGVHTFAGEKQFFHGMTLYNEVLHVPLIFRVPGAKPRQTADVVQLIDLAPTITALFGVEQPASWQGRSLVPALEGTNLAPAPSFAEMLPSKSWNHRGTSMVSADGKRHVFHRISDSRWEIYDLEKDPEERTNILDSEPKAKELQQLLAAWEQSLITEGGK